MAQGMALHQHSFSSMQPMPHSDHGALQHSTSARDSLSSRPFLPDPTEKLKLDALVERFETQDMQPSSFQVLEDELAARIDRCNLLATTHKFQSNADLAWIRRQVEDGDFWACVVHDFASTAAKLPHVLVSKIMAGIPAVIRGEVWQAMSQASSEIMSIYDELHTRPSPYERAIQRTQPDQAMRRLLHAYSVYDPHVGYNQSVADLAKPLLMTMPEKEAFSVLVRLMDNYEMRAMLVLNMEGLQVRLHQFAMLLDQQCPELADHLAKHDLDPTMYASKWYLSLFSNGVLPTDMVLRIYDLALAFGALETTTTRVAIALMRKNAAQLMAVDDFGGLVRQLTHHLTPITIDDAVGLCGDISPAKLEALAASRQQQLCDERARTQPILQARMFGAPVSQQQVQMLAGALQQLHQEHMQLAHAVESARAADHTMAWLQQHNAELEARAARYERRLATAAKNDAAFLTDDDDDYELRELLSTKMANFDLGEKCHDLEAQYHTLVNDVRVAEQERAVQAAKIDELQATVAHLRQEKDQLVDEQREIVDEKTVAGQQIQHAKQASAALQMEKLALVKQAASLEKQVDKLEQEKRDYTMPRDSFAEEVFAAHQTLFGETEQHGSDGGSTSDDEYQQRYAESEQRCRELEKMLADTKQKLSDHERQQRRRSSKRYSNGVPMSPSLYYDSSRPSTDSMASYGSKRSSIYSRIWSSIGSTAATSPASSVACKSPVLASARPIDLVEEPEEII